MGHIIIIGVFVFIWWIIISRAINDIKRAKSNKERNASPAQSDINQIDSNDKLKELVSTIKSVGDLHTSYRPQLLSFVSRVMKLDTDFALIGVNEFINGKSQTAVIVMKDGFVGSNCCKVISFNKKLGELEPYRLTTKQYVKNVTYKKKQSVVGGAIVGGIVGGDIGAVIGAVHAQNINNTGGKTAHSYVPTTVYSLMVGGNQNPLTCLTYIAAKRSIFGDRFKELEISGGSDKFILLKVGQCNQSQSSQLASFLNSWQCRDIQPTWIEENSDSGRQEKLDAEEKEAREARHRAYWEASTEEVRKTILQNIIQTMMQEAKDAAKMDHKN